MSISHIISPGQYSANYIYNMASSGGSPPPPPPPPPVDLTTGLTEYYRFQNNDTSSPDNDQSLGVSGGIYTTGLLGNCYYTDNVSSSASNTISVVSTTSWSMSFWLKVSSGPTPPNNYDSVISVYLTDSGFSDYIVVGYNRIGGSTNSSVYSPYSADQENGLVGPSPTAGSWHHFVVTNNGTSSTSLKFYVDGTYIGSDYGISGVTSNTPLFSLDTIGSAIDEMAFYSIELTQEQVTALYNGGAGIDPTA